LQAQKHGVVSHTDTSKMQRTHIFVFLHSLLNSYSFRLQARMHGVVSHPDTQKGIENAKKAMAMAALARKKRSKL
jgi:hypothetical protein